MKVTLIARTAFNAEVARELANGWEGYAKDTDGALLAEFAGRACYQSWDKPNPATADNAGYIANILDVGHFSVIEHGSITFYIEDVSRSLTHELVRHRHLSPSQLSQRYVKMTPDVRPVVPPLYQSDREAFDNETEGIVTDIWDRCTKAYDQLVEIWEQRLMYQMMSGSKPTTRIKKRAREAARCVLPNMTPTKIVMTGNHRSWRHFLELRGSIHADAEIRELALVLYDRLRRAEPALYQDFRTMLDAEGESYLQRNHGSVG